MDSGREVTNWKSNSKLTGVSVSSIFGRIMDVPIMSGAAYKAFEINSGLVVVMKERRRETE